MRDRCIDRRRHHYPVGMRGPLCKVSSSGDSAWRVRPERPSAKMDREITRVMRRRHAERQGGRAAPRCPRSSSTKATLAAGTSSPDCCG